MVVSGMPGGTLHLLFNFSVNLNCSKNLSIEKGK